MRNLSTSIATVILASCASQSPEPPGATAGTLATSKATGTQATPECLAAKLRPAEAMPVSLIPDDLLRKAQSGWVAVRYDVVAGKARNAVVVASDPPGLYDAYALKHADSYTEPTGANVRGCIMTTNIKF